MITMDKEFGFCHNILKKAIDISVKNEEDVRFEFNGVWFQVRSEVNDLHLCADKMLEYVKKETTGVVQLF